VIFLMSVSRFVATSRDPREANVMCDRGQCLQAVDSEFFDRTSSSDLDTGVW